MARVDYWNHNIHYQPIILAAVPADCGRALDVGCGDGLLAARLADRCAEVTGIDSDPPMITQARARARAETKAGTQAPDRLRFTEADFLTHPLSEASFDFVCANTSLHHMDFRQALTTMARLLKPGGRLAVIGIAADGSVGDTLTAVASVVANRYYQAVHHEGDPGAPVKAPDMTWAQVRSTARRLLPGVRYRRRLLWRYSLLWTKP
jgi:ubiquinone/menaquinone biosynthesis C-methylase UbiE